MNRPGVYEVPIGLTLRELIVDQAGGMRDGQKLKAIAPSGPSGGFLPAALARGGLPRGSRSASRSDSSRNASPPARRTSTSSTCELDLQLFRDLGLMLGAGFVVYGDRADMVDQALNAVAVLPQRVVRQVRPLPDRLAEAGRPGAPTSPSAGAIERGLATAEGLIGELKQHPGDDLDLRPGAGRRPTPSPASSPTSARTWPPTCARAARPDLDRHVRGRGATAMTDMTNATSFEILYDDEEGVYARDIEGRLVRMDEVTAEDLDLDVTLKIDGKIVTVKKAVPATDAQGNILTDEDGLAIPRATTIYDAAAKLFGKAPGDVNPIPILCHREHMNPVAVCRVCVVEISKVKRGKMTTRAEAPAGLPAPGRGDDGGPDGRVAQRPEAAAAHPLGGRAC